MLPISPFFPYRCMHMGNRQLLSELNSVWNINTRSVIVCRKNDKNKYKNMGKNFCVYKMQKKKEKKIITSEWNKQFSYFSIFFFAFFFLFFSRFVMFVLLLHEISGFYRLIKRFLFFSWTNVQLEFPFNYVLKQPPRRNFFLINFMIKKFVYNEQSIISLFSMEKGVSTPL